VECALCTPVVSPTAYGQAASCPSIWTRADRWLVGGPKMKRTSASATRVRPGPQPHTLSVRISDVMRQRLQRIRDLAASKTGVRMSLSAVAKGLLESAREDR